MRVHLVNLQIILDALARNDMGAVAKAARASGVQAATEADQRMMKQLPKNFVELGVSMHRDFDVIADEAEKAKDPKLTLSALSATLQKCVACHATYQVRLRRPAPKK
jgi:cytochrome c556